MKKDTEKCNNIAYHEEIQRRLGVSEGLQLDIQKKHGHDFNLSEHCQAPNLQRLKIMNLCFKQFGLFKC